MQIGYSVHIYKKKRSSLPRLVQNATRQKYIGSGNSVYIVLYSYNNSNTSDCEQRRGRSKKSIIPFFFSLDQTLTIFLFRYIYVDVDTMLYIESDEWILCFTTSFTLPRISPHSLSAGISRVFHVVALILFHYRSTFPCAVRACVFVFRMSYRIASRLEPVARTPLNIYTRRGMRM